MRRSTLRFEVVADGEFWLVIDHELERRAQYHKKDFAEAAAEHLNHLDSPSGTGILWRDKDGEYVVD